MTKEKSKSFATTSMVDDNISPVSSLLGTTVGTQTSTVTTLPSPSLAHQLPLKLALSIYFIVEDVSLLSTKNILIINNKSNVACRIR